MLYEKGPRFFAIVLEIHWYANDLPVFEHDDEILILSLKVLGSSSYLYMETKTTAHLKFLVINLKWV